MHPGSVAPPVGPFCQRQPFLCAEELLYRQAVFSKTFCEEQNLMNRGMLKPALGQRLNSLFSKHHHSTLFLQDGFERTVLLSIMQDFMKHIIL